LREKGGGIYIHTSGTDVLLDPSKGIDSKAPKEGVKVFDDWDGIGELRSLPGMYSLLFFSTHTLLQHTEHDTTPY
jgi:hypothetical protein